LCREYSNMQTYTYTHIYSHTHTHIYLYSTHTIPVVQLRSSVSQIFQRWSKRCLRSIVSSILRCPYLLANPPTTQSKFSKVRTLLYLRNEMTTELPLEECCADRIYWRILQLPSRHFRKSDRYSNC